MYDAACRAAPAQIDAQVTTAALVHPNPDLFGALLQRYCKIATERALPLLVLTDTFRASDERHRQSEVADRDLNGDAVRLLLETRTHSPARTLLSIAGEVGPRGDCYRPEQALDAGAAAEFH